MVISKTTSPSPTLICDEKCKLLIKATIAEIQQDYALSKRIFEKTGTDDPEIVDMINYSTVISICIKYETFTSDLMNLVTRRRVAFNRPWSYTRFLASRFQVNINQEYERAHDAWEYYNSLKHVNSRSKMDNLNFSKKYNLTSSWMSLRFARESLIALLEKLLASNDFSNPSS